ncbi:MAG: DUF3482 domain-containing protein [Wenzhouxiangella sp.]|nr:MAG: DUF3482 domain-containing protein [Wenzhouxiangella sp.]
MKTPLLRIAVVGHTNTGKTSLVRTLSHQRRFGTVADRGGTTRQVSAVRLGTAAEALVELYDSPGLENAPQLIETLDALPGERHDGPTRIAQFLADPELVRRFDQEARVLELMLAADVGLYVIDVREPVLEKYLDELAILALGGRPLLAVLNFTASSESREDKWREALARVQLHTVLSFDAAVRDPLTERRLFEKLASMLDGFEPTLKRWLEHRRDEESERRRSAVKAIAELLIDVAALRRDYALSSAAERARELGEIRRLTRQREQACVETLLALYRFARDDYREAELPLVDGQWPDPPLDPQTLALYGMRTGRHLGAGAGIGAVFDVATGGLSLGAGTLVGGAIGAGTGLLRSAGERMLERARGRGRLGVDDSALRVLAWRQLSLLAQLIRRGHGSPEPLTPTAESRWKRERLPAALSRARHHPGWSALNDDAAGDDARQTACARLCAELEQDLNAVDMSPD